MDLEVSTWTRRERLERIASAERDRRAGRIDLALATLGEGGEWPARVVLALIRLPEEEGTDARAILEASLDDWASDSGLEGLDAIEAPAATIESNEVDTAFSEDVDEVVAPAVNSADALAEPIEFDELDRAFAEAEAQTDEMHDVNTVAARVLMDEPLGLAELSGDAFAAIDEGIDDEVGALDSDVIPNTHDAAALQDVSAEEQLSTRESESGLDAAEVPSDAPVEDDAVYAARALWPMSYDVDPTDPNTFAFAAEQADDPSNEAVVMAQPSRAVVIATLEKWLTNLESHKAGRAQS